jgi:hypothetical protein
MTTNIEIRGLKELQANLDRQARELSRQVTKIMDRAVKYAHSQVPKYPSPPDGSSYTRTGQLGRSIHTEVRGIGADTVGVIGTATVYAPWVIDEEHQAWMHKGRWYTLQSVVRKSMDGIMKIFNDEISKLLGGGHGI